MIARVIDSYSNIAMTDEAESQQATAGRYPIRCIEKC